MSHLLKCYLLSDEFYDGCNHVNLMAKIFFLKCDFLQYSKIPIIRPPLRLSKSGL